MLIKELDIVSFGKWNREKISLRDGFNYFHGPNEAGKSSIRMFMTYILFGLKPYERERYRSKVDGQLGGRLVVELDDQEWIIERLEHRNRGKRVGFINGNQVSEEDIELALKGLNRFLFESIFSFQDRDLQFIRKYRPEDIGKVLFNLGLTGSEQITELENKLLGYAESLFKKHGRRPPLNEKLNQIKKLDQEIEQVERSENQHQALYEQVRKRQKELTDLKHSHDQLSDQAKQLEKLIQVKDSIVKYQILDVEIQQFNEVKQFPSNAKERFEKLKEQSRGYVDKLNMVKSNIQQVEQELDDYEYKSKLNQWLMSISEAERIIQQATDLKHKISHLVEQKNGLHYQFHQVLRNLGLEFSVDDLSSLAINSYTNENWKRLVQQLENVKTRQKEIKRKIIAKQEELDAEVQYEKQVKHNMLEEHDVKHLKEQNEQIKMAKQEQVMKRQLQAEMKTQQKAMKKMERSLRMTKLIAPIFIGVIMLYNIFTTFSNNWTDYGILAAMAVISMVVLLFINRQHIDLKRSLNSNYKPLNENFLDESEKQLSKINQKLDHYEKQKKELEDVIVKKQFIESNLNELKVEHDHVSDELRTLEKEIENEIEKFPFLSNYELYQWPNVYENLEAAKSYAQNLDHIKEQMHDYNSKLNELNKKAYSVLKLYEPDFLMPYSETLWDKFKEKIELEKEWLNHKKQLDNRLIDLTNQYESYSAAYQPYQQEMEELFSSLGVQAEEEFLAMAETYNQYVEKKKQLSEAYTFIYEIFGNEAQNITKQSYDWNELSERSDKLQKSIKETNNRIEEIRHQISEKQAQIKQIEETGVLSDLVHNRALLEAEITQLAKEWSVYKTAEAFIIETKNRYQNVYLPDIMEQTRTYFNELTNSQYKDLQFVNDEETILAQKTTGDWYHIGQLSEGTADQLYVSLRLALNDSFKKVIKAPFVLDDAFVHFDHKRKENMLNRLRELSSEQQIIYLTCEPNHSNQFEYMDLTDSIVVN
ncbi:DNA double-strand break repair Rad50 ATPase [Tenuibacillus multivorans]|nr:AAA family ATPase [Tenuibacillus multivorans]GEL78802.1 DNA double-strand break repair Rad50 ATPase [Tenuibacillus multivorans]